MLDDTLLKYWDYDIPDDICIFKKLKQWHIGLT